MNALTRLFLRLLASSGKDGKLSIFVFHRVLLVHDEHLPSIPSAGEFEWIVEFICRNFTVLPLRSAARQLSLGRLPPAPACITFDDGYLDNLTVATPILKRHGATATFFVATGFLGGKRMWNDEVIQAFRCAPRGEFRLEKFGLENYELVDVRSRVEAYDNVLDQLKYVKHEARTAIAREIAACAGVGPMSDLMMSAANVLELHRDGMEIGAHTHTHPILELVQDSVAEAEILESRERLEKLLNAKVSCFAYPNGKAGKDFSRRHIEMVSRSGFTAAVATTPGAASQRSDVFQLPRFTPWDKTPMRFGARCALNLLKGCSNHLVAETG